MIKPLGMTDIPRVLQIQSQCYAGPYLEDTRSFQAKIRFFPEGSLGVVQENAPTRLLGYLISFPWLEHVPVPLNSSIFDPAQEFTCYYIHDLAIRPSSRCSGLGQILTERAEFLAEEHGFLKIYLVSVQNSSGYWKKRGFSEENAIPYGGEHSGQPGCLVVKHLSR